MGLKWPPTAGWLKSLRGSVVSTQVYERFVALGKTPLIRASLPKVATVNPPSELVVHHDESPHDVIERLNLLLGYSGLLFNTVTTTEEGRIVYRLISVSVTKL